MNPARPLPGPIADVLETSLGRRYRDDATTAPSGGPAGNAQFTAWLGLTLLVLFLGELFTVLDVNWLISWHIAIGVLLIPPALAKTATTGWRLVRYYTGHPPYVSAGPPPLLLRLLGPLVVAGTLAVLATGVVLIAFGPTSGFRPLVRLPGLAVSPLTLHQASFIVWAAATGLHVLTRLVSAVRLTGRGSRGAPGLSFRAAALAATLIAAAALSVLGLRLGSDWTQGAPRSRHRAHVPPNLNLQMQMQMQMPMPMPPRPTTSAPASARR